MSLPAWHSPSRMMLKLPALFALLFIVAGCTGRVDDVPSANAAMKSIWASASSVKFDAPSERYFPLHLAAKDGSPSKYDFVCGRVTINRPGSSDDPHRFVFTIVDGGPGLPLIDSGDSAAEMKTFDADWAERCTGYALAREQGVSAVQAGTVSADAKPPGLLAVDIKATTLAPLGTFVLPPKRANDVLQSLVPTKGQYESDAQALARRKTVVGKTLLPGVKVGDLIAFQADEVSFSYDANKEVWNYDVSPSPVDDDYGYVRISDELLPAAQFPDDDRYYRSRFRDVSFHHRVVVEVRGMKGFSDILGSIKVPRDQAAPMKDSMSVILVGRIVPARLKEYTRHAYRDDDTEQVLQQGIGFDLAGVWLIDNRDGRVLTKAYRIRRVEGT